MSAYINGHFVDEAQIPMRDLGFLRGYGVFEYLRTYNGRLFHLRDHLERLSRSASLIGLELPHSLDEIAKIAMMLKKEREATVRLIVTGGVSPDGITPGKSALYALANPLANISYSPIRLCSTYRHRLLPAAKTLHYVSAILALKEAREKDAHDALFLTAQDEILEATTSNFFAFKGNTLITSNSNEILRGITRSIILKLAKEEFRVEERPLFYHELSEIHEAFLTSSIKEIVPVVQIDGISLSIGTYTMHLKTLFHNYTLSDCWEDSSLMSFSTNAHSS